MVKVRQTGANESPAEPVAKPKQTRSSIERTVVWAAIAVLLALAAVETHARIGYSRSLNAIDEAFDSDQPDGALALADAERLISGFPVITARAGPASEVRSYRWWSMLHDYRIHLRVETGDEPREVIAFATGSDTLSRRAVLPSNPAPPPEQGPGEIGVPPGPERQSGRDEPTAPDAAGNDSR